eukprot:9711132-Alexandrium_andersonii.AAC.1
MHLSAGDGAPLAMLKRQAASACASLFHRHPERETFVLNEFEEVFMSMNIPWFPHDYIFSLDTAVSQRLVERQQLEQQRQEQQQQQQQAQ